MVLLLWTAFALLSSAHFLVRDDAGRAQSPADLALHILVFYWGWALLTPLFPHLARDVAERGLAARIRAALLAPVVILAHALLYYLLLRAVRIAPGLTLDTERLWAYLLRHGGGDLATYAALLGLFLLVDARRRARERERAALALEARLAQADLKLLRWQLQPHFLFNTLNTLSTLVLKGDTPAAERAIALIARWLRAALAQRSDAVVTVDQELATVAQYAEIEALRFGGTLRLDVRLSPEALAATIPSLVVQPLVENAIRHGAAAADGSAPIRISGAVVDGRLRLAVRDGGPGDLRSGAETNAMPGDSATRPAISEGFGLRYVRNRLAQFYGTEARLHVVHEGAAVVATLDLPVGTHR